MAFKKGQTPWNKGKHTGIIPTNAYKKGHPKSFLGKRIHTQETKDKISKKLKGRISWIKGKHWSKEVKEKLSLAHVGKKLTEEHKTKIGIAVSGERNGNWIENRSLLKKQDERNDSAYQEFVKQVKKRDNHKCRINNEDCSGYCIVHHILSWSEYPELRYNINNGITLCQAHHPRKRAEEQLLTPTFQELISQMK